MECSSHTFARCVGLRTDDACLGARCQRRHKLITQRPEHIDKPLLCRK